MWAAAGNARPVDGRRMVEVSAQASVTVRFGGGAFRFTVRLETFVFSLILCSFILSSFTVLHDYFYQHFPVQFVVWHKESECLFVCD